MKNKKILILGIDGGTWKIINSMIHQNQLPNFKRIIDEGCYGKLKSTVPFVTPPAWTSISTGKNPAKHGIFDFFSVVKENEQFKLKLYTSKSKKSKEIWDYIDGNSIVINLPLSYPPKKINGIMVSGMYTPSKTSNFCYPSEFQAELTKNFPEYSTEPQWDNKNIDSFADNVNESTKARIRLFWHLFKKEWNFFFFVIVGTDRLQHFFWNNEKLFEYYRYIDDFLGNVLKEIENDDVTLFIVSDHGFSKLKKLVHINTVFKNKGLLSLKNNNKNNLLNMLGINRQNLNILYMKFQQRGLTNYIPEFLINKFRKNIPGTSNPIYDFDLLKSKCFSVSSGLIYITEKDKAKKDEIVKKIIKNIKDLKDPDTNENIIHKIFTKEELFNGFYSKDAPDLIISPNEGYEIVSKITNEIFEKPKEKNGCHSIDGIILMYGNKLKKGKKIDAATVYDIAPTILHILDIPLDKEFDGRVLLECFKDDIDLSKKEVRYESKKINYDESTHKLIQDMKKKGLI